jgi:Pin2-interacting protein X1
MAHLLVTGKTLEKHGQQMNNSVGSKPSAFAMKLMEKMGWKEGQGLGKNEDGMAKHIVITKREDNMGLGLDNSKAADSVQEQWWHNSFSKTLANFTSSMQGSDSDSDDSSKKNKKKKDKKKNKKEKKSSKDKKKSKKSSDDPDNSNSQESKGSKKRKREEEFVSEEPGSINYDELFKATGGARLGMRARREQKGKILRTEGVEALVVNKK